MPITEQLQTSEQLQQAGLPRAAAVLIAEKIEAAAQTTHDTALDRFRTELRSEMAALEARITSKIDSYRAEVAAFRADLEKSIRVSQTVVLAAMGIVVAVVGGFGTAILTVLLKR